MTDGCLQGEALDAALRLQPPAEIGTAHTEDTVSNLHPSWDKAPARLRAAAEAIEAHPWNTGIGYAYDNLGHAAEAYLQMGPEAFWEEIRLELELELERDAEL